MSSDSRKRFVLFALFVVKEILEQSAGDISRDIASQP